MQRREPDLHTKIREIQYSPLVSGERGGKFGESWNHPGLACHLHEWANFVMVLSVLATCGEGSRILFNESGYHELDIAPLIHLQISLLVWFTRKPYTCMENEMHVCAQVVHFETEEKKGKLQHEYFLVRYFHARLILRTDAVCMHATDRKLIKTEKLFVQGPARSVDSDDKSVIYRSIFYAIQNEIVALDDEFNNANQEKCQIVHVKPEVNYMDWARFSCFGANMVASFVDFGVLHGEQEWKIMFSNFDISFNGVKDSRTPSVTEKMLHTFLSLPNDTECPRASCTLDKSKIPIEGDQVKIMNPLIPDNHLEKSHKMNKCMMRLIEGKHMDEDAVGLQVSLEPHGILDQYIVQSFDEKTKQHTLQPMDSAKSPVQMSIDGIKVKFDFQHFISDQAKEFVRCFPDGSHVNLNYKVAATDKTEERVFSATLIFSQAGAGKPLLKPFHVLIWIHGKGLTRFRNCFFFDEPIEVAPLPLATGPSVDNNVFFDRLVSRRGLADDLQSIVYDQDKTFLHSRTLLENERVLVQTTEFEARVLAIPEEKITITYKNDDNEDKVTEGCKRLWVHLPKLPEFTDYCARKASEAMLFGIRFGNTLGKQQKDLRSLIIELSGRADIRNKRRRSGV